MPGTLVLCATPIGNLGDISSRLAETLEAADVIYAEDTRRTGQLLNHLGVSARMKSFFAGNEQARLDELHGHLEEGKLVALVSDAGMPVISDPGASAVEVAVRAGAVITAVPGPSAVVTAVAVSGFGGDRFVFDGFLPRKGKQRREALDRLAAETRTAVLFSAPSRIGRDLDDLGNALGGDRRIAVTRELTKLHEEVWRGSVTEAASEFSSSERARGEFTVVIAGGRPITPSIDDAVDATVELVASGASMSDAVRTTAASHGVSRRELYDRVLRSRPETPGTADPA